MKTCLLLVLAIAGGSTYAQAKFTPFAAESGRVTLRAQDGQNGFAECAARAALDSGAFTFERILFIEPETGLPTIHITKIHFEARTGNGTPSLMRLNVLSTDPTGWDLVQGQSGEIFATTASINKMVILNDRNGVVGAKDISRCFARLHEARLR